MDTHRIQLKPGQVLFRERDPPDAAYLVEAGRLAITAGSDQRRIAEVCAGELLGEMAVIDRSPRTATATAIEPCVLLAITPGQIAERLLNTDPVVRALLEGQLRRYRNTLAETLGQVAVAGREQDGHEALLGIDKIRLEGELRDALKQGQLEARFQPLLEIGSGRIAGYEALVRWQHPRRGWISPAEFIALAEETSLILPIGDYVLELALDALMHLDQGPGGTSFVAINVSARQLLEEGLLSSMIERIRRRALDPGRIKIELTESRALDPTRVALMMQQARAAGMKVALDDFGTGYSNLQYMHLLPFDTLKVDQAFVRNMHESERALRIVEAIVGMAHSLGADVVVEGVETPEQLAQLTTLGCRYAQGWWVGKPQTLSELRQTPP